MPAHRLFEGGHPAPERVDEYPLVIKDRCRPIAASLIIPGWNENRPLDPDFDIFLEDPDGNEVARGDSIERQDDLDADPDDNRFAPYRPEETGTYKLRVESFRGKGPYFVDVSAGFGTPPPSASAICGAPPPEPPSEPPAP